MTVNCVWRYGSVPVPCPPVAAHVHPPEPAVNPWLWTVCEGMAVCPPLVPPPPPPHPPEPAVNPWLWTVCEGMAVCPPFVPPPPPPPEPAVNPWLWTVCEGMAVCPPLVPPPPPPPKSQLLTHDCGLCEGMAVCEGVPAPCGLCVKVWPPSPTPPEPAVNPWLWTVWRYGSVPAPCPPSPTPPEPAVNPWLWTVCEGMAVCPPLVPLLLPMPTPQSQQQQTGDSAGSSDSSVSVEKLLAKMKGCVDTYASRLKSVLISWHFLFSLISLWVTFGSVRSFMYVCPGSLLFISRDKNFSIEHCLTNSKWTAACHCVVIISNRGK